VILSIAHNKKPSSFLEDEGLYAYRGATTISFNPSRERNSIALERTHPKLALQFHD